MVTLKEFISETLNSITEVVLEFEDKFQATTGATAMPRVFNNHEHAQKNADYSTQYPVGGPVIIDVNFDLMVAASEREEGERTVGGSVSAGAKFISVISAKAEISGEGRKTNESAEGRSSRVSFSIPLMLPNRTDTPTSDVG